MEPIRRNPPVEHSAKQTNHRSRLIGTIRPIKKTAVLVAATVLIITIAIVANWPTPGLKPTASTAKQTAAPQYQTVLPSGKSIKELGGWKKLTPPQGSPFYSYIDTVDGIKVNVSQQQLPKPFQGNTNQKVAELAKSYNATSKITVNGAKVYIGKSAKGPQSVIFTRDNLLVLIQSERSISNASWQHYITSLEAPSSTDSTSY